MKTIRLSKMTAYKSTKTTVYIAAILALTCTSTAFAQYVWLNEKGVKQYSDMPPPSSVPKNRILKEPGSATPSSTMPSAEPAADEQKSASDDKAPQTWAEKNAEFQKRKMEQAEKDKKAAEQQQKNADKAKNCERARAYQRALESGERIARKDQNGERQFISDQQRAQETRENKRIIDDSCK